MDTITTAGRIAAAACIPHRTDVAMNAAAMVFSFDVQTVGGTCSKNSSSTDATSGKSENSKLPKLRTPR
jgi:hypothetical protein